MMGIFIQGARVAWVFLFAGILFVMYTLLAEIYGAFLKTGMNSNALGTFDGLIQRPFRDRFLRASPGLCDV